MAARCLLSPSPALNNSHCSSAISNRLECISPASTSLSRQILKCRTFSADRTRRHGQKLVIRAAAVDDDGGDGAAESKKGRQLWSSELQSNGELSSEFESTLERDIEQLAKKERLEKLWSRQQDGGSQNQAAPDQRGVAIREIVDKILVADFFFILFILGWLLAGLAERAALESTNLIDSWLPLWPSVFQPALGVFMAGAIVSALSKKE